MEFDLSLFNVIHNLSGKSICFDSLAIFLARDFIWFLPLSLFLFWFFYRQKIKCGRLFFLWLGSFVLAYTLLFIIQSFYFRERPFVAFKFLPLIDVVANDPSFPSFHAILALVFALTIFFLNRFWGVIFIFLALLIGLARVYVGVHWPSDILVGFILALLSFYLNKIFFKSINL